MTRVLKLPTGVEAEIDEMDTSHQRLLTEQKNGTGNERLNLLVESRLVRLGSIRLSTLSKEERKTLVLNILSRDKRKILVEIRQLTYEDDMSMSFKYKYKSKLAGDQYGKEKKAFVDGKLAFSDEPYKKISSVPSETKYPSVEDMNATEYSEVTKDVHITLPKSKKQARFTLLDGHSEKRASFLKRDDISSNSQIEVRNPVYLVTEDKQGEKLKEPIWVKINIDKLHPLDTEYLRKVIDMVEGESVSDVTFRHPEADIMEDEYVTMGALGESAFFFPSGVI